MGHRMIAAKMRNITAIPVITIAASTKNVGMPHITAVSFMRLLMMPTEL